MKFFKDLKQASILLRRNWRALVLFELLYKFVVVVLSIALIKGGIQLLLHFTGLAVVTQENITAWLRNPAALAAILLLALYAAFVSLLDSMAVIHCMNASHHNETVTAQDLFAAGLRSALRALRPKNWMLVVFILIIAPLTQSHVASGLVTNLQIPGFVADYINASLSLRIIKQVIILVLTLFSYMWLFSLHTFLFDAKTYPQAQKKSSALLRLHLFRCITSTFFWLLILILCFLLMIAAASGVACVVIRLCVDPQEQLYIGIIAVSTISDVLSSLWQIFSVPLSFAFLTAIYYDCRQEAAYPETPAPRHTPQPKPVRILWRVAAFGMVVLLALNLVTEGIYTNIRYNADGSLVVQPKIAAHRGSSIDKPENTMPAYEQAIADGADWIEMDVHQTKDGVVVVSHDASLKRIAGVNKNIYDLTYAELTTYDVGSWFDPQYSYLRILTLDELIKAVKGKILLNIELKPTGHEPNFEENVIQIVRNNNFTDQCVLASLSQKTIRRIEELDPEMNSLYLMAAEQGRLWNLDFADGFSIEESFVSANLVSTLHSHGKTVWAWTLNSVASLEAMQAAGVDYLLTDDPVMARAVVSANRMDATTAQILRLVFPAPPEAEVAEESPAEILESA